MENLSTEHDSYMSGVDYELDLDIHNDEAAFGHITADDVNQMEEYILSFQRARFPGASDDDGERQDDDDEDFLAARFDEDEDEWDSYTCCGGHGCDYCRCVG